MLPLPLAENTIALYGFMLAALFTIAMLMLRGNRYFGRKTQQVSAAVSPERNAAGSGLPPSAHLQADRERWEVEMHELARAFSAQVDTKMGRLEQLIRDADRAAARLEAALAVAQRVAWQTPLGGRPLTPRVPASDGDTAADAAGGNACQGQRPSCQAAKLLAAEEQAAPASLAAEAAAAPTAAQSPQGPPAPVPPTENSPQADRSQGSAKSRAER